MRSALLVILVAAMLAVPTTVAAQARAPVVEVFKTPTCGCCNKWVEHLRAHGFTVQTHNLDSLGQVKARYDVPPQLQSCHTAVVNGYAVEGHVPVADVQRLLKERPGIAGLAVPGMPIGSPGMEVAGKKPQAYNVVAFDRGGKTRVFASHGG